MRERRRVVSIESTHLDHDSTKKRAKERTSLRSTVARLEACGDEVEESAVVVVVVAVVVEEDSGVEGLDVEQYGRNK